MRFAICSIEEITERGTFRGLIYDSFVRGIARFGHTCRNYHKKDIKKAIRKCDVMVFLGVTSASQELFDYVLSQGKKLIYIDKGFYRSPDLKHELSKTFYYRVSCNAFQPLHYLHDFDFPYDRLRKLCLPFEEMKTNPEGRIVFAGSSQKYCDFYEIGDATVYAKDIFARVREFSDVERELVYRPKPSWDNALPIDGTVFSGPKNKLRNELAKDAYGLITHGSNAAFEALIDGYPVFVLGDGIVKELGQSSLSDIENPKYPSIKERKKVFKDIAYHQYSIDEFIDGTAWDFLRQNIDKELS